MAPKRETALDAWGRELAYACEAAGLAGKQLAETLHVAPSTVSQWMNGRRTPHLDDVERCDEALSTNGYLARYFKKWVTREIPSEWAGRWREAEARANLLQSYDPSSIPGLLQTPNYIRAILRHNRHSPIAIDERVRRRLERRSVLDDESPPMCIFVIDEHALRRMVGGRDVMIEQLRQLCDLAMRPNIVIKIVPSGADYFVSTPFMIARLDGVDLVNLDDALIGRIIEGGAEVVEMAKIWEDIREAALPPQDSVALMEKVTEEWEL
ncbi:helix-turn-helix transcriptional regulator [Actinoallomurus sp. NPDC050550]|uniref:helix-turn-helix domain-containing protein n=1 Tax=Actinoallomurus sp. NPDC050550 TaxID=3154937 RepID=UPI0033D151AC